MKGVLLFMSCIAICDCVQSEDALTKPMWVKEFEEIAKAKLPALAWRYYSAGADTGFTLENNEAAYRKYTLRPSVLQDVSEIDMSVKFLGTNVSMPLGFSPAASQRMASSGGETDTARAAAVKGLTMILSIFATSTIEDVSDAFKSVSRNQGQLWAQSYVTKNRSVVVEVARRAKKAGFTAIVLTVDQPYYGFKRRIAKEGFWLPEPISYQLLESLGNLTFDGLGGELLNGEDLSNPGATWEDIKFLRQQIDIKLVLKGILTPEDAKMAVKYGAEAIIVSNHGGRQLDFAPAPIDVLPDIVSAVGKKIEVYIDGGIRSGTDIVKALARGAKGVFIGRPLLWGLAYNGSSGVEEVVSILHRETKLAMGLLGANRPSALTPSMVKQDNVICN